MNDLTKEELYELSNLVEFSILDYGQLSSKSKGLLIPLFDKLQSMIDDYCEHKTSTLKIDHECIICDNCKKVVA